LVEYHQSVTVAVLCLTLIFGVAPGLPILHKILDDPDRPVVALFIAANALLLTSIAGLIAVTALAAQASKGSADELPDEPDWGDVAEIASIDD
jgi:hypothetical protein